MTDTNSPAGQVAEDASPPQPSTGTPPQALELVGLEPLGEMAGAAGYCTDGMCFHELPSEGQDGARG